MKKKMSIWLLTFAVLFAFSALSFAQATPGVGQNTTAEATSSNVSPNKSNKKEKKPRKPRKTQKQK